uniref:peptidylprolyl isomerase n=1 Tax=Noctiluca scintillans TaxID=2966 RepID=A0A7S1AXB9_NOCSC|mmetsp:Transcript_64076/g.169795  ORF Transcript_64076/g.169795 Transcript_64076/m.169795 type:complete len:385 (+) Transcript_64076:71-1225(+)
MCSTSREAFELAQEFCKAFDLKENIAKAKAERSQRDSKPSTSNSNDDSRQVTQINYGKHEDTVKELEQQEKEETRIRKQLEAANRPPSQGCSHDHQKEWAIYEKTTDEKVAGADRFREEGNDAFRKQNFGLAAVHYRKALLQFDYTIPETPAEEKKVDTVKIACLLNLAACKCQQEDWDEVLTHCRLALEIDPRSVKAYYRSGLAHLARDQFDLARDMLTSAYDIEPKNPQVIETLKSLKKKMANYKSRQREVFTTMVSGADDGKADVTSDGTVGEGTAAQANPSDPAGGPLVNATTSEDTAVQSSSADGKPTAEDGGADGSKPNELRQRGVRHEKAREAESGESDDEVLLARQASMKRASHAILCAAVCLALIALVGAAVLGS